MSPSIRFLDHVFNQVFTKKHKHIHFLAKHYMNFMFVSCNMTIITQSNAPVKYLPLSIMSIFRPFFESQNNLGITTASKGSRKSRTRCCGSLRKIERWMQYGTEHTIARNVPARFGTSVTRKRTEAMKTLQRLRRLRYLLGIKNCESIPRESLECTCVGWGAAATTLWE
jgi:hypothetical protein